MDFLKLWLVLSSSVRRGPGAAWMPRRSLVRWDCSSVGCTSHRAASSCLVEAGHWGKGSGWQGLGDGCTPQMTAWGEDGVCEPGAGGNTVGSYQRAVHAHPPAVACDLAPHLVGRASVRHALASAVWLFCSETKPDDMRTNSAVRKHFLKIVHFGFYFILPAEKRFRFRILTFTFVSEHEWVQQELNWRVLEFLVSSLYWHTGGRIWDLYCSQPAGFIKNLTIRNVFCFFLQ